MGNKKALKKEKINNFKSSLNFDKSIFVKNLKSILADNQIMNTVLADCIGVSYQTITNWLSNLPYEIEVAYKLFAFLTQEVNNFNLKMLLDN